MRLFRKSQPDDIPRNVDFTPQVGGVYVVEKVIVSGRGITDFRHLLAAANIEGIPCVVDVWVGNGTSCLGHGWVMAIPNDSSVLGAVLKHSRDERHFSCSIHAGQTGMEVVFHNYQD